MSRFDEIIDRALTPATKFNPAALRHFFGTDDLYPFWVADEDFRSPPEVVEALIEKAHFGVFGYEYKPASFMEAFCNWCDTRYGYRPDKNIVQPSPTIMTSMAMMIDLLTHEGDGIIIQPPVYMEFKNTVEKTGRKTVDNPLLVSDTGKYVMDTEELKKLAADPDNKILLLCNPHNPGGRVWSENELARVAAICRENDLFLISDEIHADVILPGHRFTSMMKFEEIHDRLMVCYSPAKVFNVASICDSFALIPDNAKREKFNHLRLRYNLGRTNAFGRVAMQKGFETAGSWVDELNEYIAGNVTFIRTFLEERLPEVKLMEPEGTYLVWLDVSKLPLQGDKLIRHLAKEAKAGLNNGEAFGPAGAGFVRMNIACPRKILEETLPRIEKAVINL